MDNYNTETNKFKTIFNKLSRIIMFGILIYCLLQMQENYNMSQSRLFIMIVIIMVVCDIFLPSYCITQY